MSDRAYRAWQIQEIDQQIERLKLSRRDALQKLLRAGYLEPDPYFFDEMHARLADRLERRFYKMATASPAEKLRLNAKQDRENAIAATAWERMKKAEL